ncbi:AI-2E family transporter [Candidatus Peregrinibacteria bacterium HGW-Peregrinibacteria-1]|jgi:predicted PurR-regulated permease PerM|nr:MAG: AI-2E family transporter [Candidatus Peregrinibacteria bacterium HGW-Peregrinibacteria-1]
MKLLNFTLSAILLFLIFTILVGGKDILMPFVIAIIIWYFVISLVHVFQKLKFPGIKKRKMKYWQALTLSVLTCLAVLFCVSWIVNNSINQVIAQAPKYEEKLKEVVVRVENFMDFEFLQGESEDEIAVDETVIITGQQVSSIDKSPSLIERIDFVEFFTKFAQALGNIARNMGVILIYVLFLLIESRTFGKKLKNMVPDQGKYDATQGVLSRIVEDVNEYLKIKSLVSLATAILSYIALKIIGVDFAEFWAFLIFLLNFIPIIGSFIAVLFPVLLSLIQFPTIYPFVAVVIILFTIQIIMSQIIEPRLTGDSLNLSPLVILLSLAFWGSVWGVVGAILCVPIMVIINIVLAKFEKTRWLAVLMSAKGNV